MGTPTFSKTITTFKKFVVYLYRVQKLYRKRIQNPAFDSQQDLNAQMLMQVVDFR